MSEHRTDLHCPHCNQRLRAFKVPDASTYNQAIHWACFNDDCPYFRDGWQWMEEMYAAKASYRYRVTDAAGACSSPLAVWSMTAIRDLIVSDEEAKRCR
jgi:hypothetical protein